MTTATAEIQPDDNKSNKPSHIAYATRRSGEKTIWKSCGAAWAHKDSKGFRVKLDAMPISGVIELRVNEPDAASDTSKIDWTDFSEFGEVQ